MTINAKKVLAILCGDIHLSHKPPIGRFAEPSWYAAMERQLKQLRDLQVKYNCPVICAGDVFDKWNSPAELINFAIAELPQQFYAIPGQHDLPNHRLDDIYRSAYWTLAQAGQLGDLLTGRCRFGDLVVYAFPWGADPTPILREGKRGIHLAVVHAYCWHGPGTKYPGAPAKSRLSNRLKKLKGYDAILFGDNHQFWHDPKTNSVNCGTFMRRKYDDSLECWVAALLDTGEIHPLVLDSSKDKWVHIDDGIRKLERDWGVQEFIEDLSQLGDHGLDFADQVRRFVHDSKLDERTRQLILTALEESQ